MVTVPPGLSVEGAIELRRLDPHEYTTRSMESMARHVEAMLALKRNGAMLSITETTFVRWPSTLAAKTHSKFPASCLNTFAAYSAKAKGRFAGSRCQVKRRTYARQDDLALELFPDDKTLNRWLRLSRDRVKFQGLALAHLLARLWRARRDGRSD
jgi:urocanate hydratase